MIIEAAKFAAQAHTGQKRDGGQPYIFHPIRVAGICCLAHKTNKRVIAAAYLHDVVEDTNYEIGDILTMFGQRVAFYVEGLTDVFTKERYPNMSRSRRKKNEHERIGAYKHRYIHTIKAADRYDNLCSIFDKTGSGFVELYLKETFFLLDELQYADTMVMETALAQAKAVQKQLKEKRC